VLIAFGFPLLQLKRWIRTCSTRRIFLEVLGMYFLFSLINKYHRYSLELDLNTVILLIALGFPMVQFKRWITNCSFKRVFLEFLAFYLVFAFLLTKTQPSLAIQQEELLEEEYAPGICRMSDWEYPEEYFNEDRVKNDEIVQFGIINRSPESRGLGILNYEKLAKSLKKASLVSLDEARQTKEPEKQIIISRFRRSRNNLQQEDQDQDKEKNVFKPNDIPLKEKSETWRNAKKVLVGAGIIYGIVHGREIIWGVYGKVSEYFG
jgi:Ca2+/Na+ antiporter